MGQPAEGGPEGTGSVGGDGAVGSVVVVVASVVDGVTIPPVVVGGVSVKVEVVYVDEELITDVDSVDVTVVTDDETVTSVVDVFG
jgi:hypothetical protein